MSTVRLEPEFEPRLVETSVLEAMRGHAREHEFHVERDAVYDVVDPERREAAFTALHGRWFARAALDRPFHAALAEQPAVSRACARWLVGGARAARDEAADLLVGPDTGRTLLVRVHPRTVAAPASLLRFLRRELLHVADMVDAAFGYEAALPLNIAGGPRAQVVRDRYRVLWNSYVDGRLLRRGHVPPAARQERIAEFGRAFPGLGARTGATFEKFFGGQRLTHAALLAFACGEGS
jgi:hypothetical protein